MNYIHIQKNIQDSPRKLRLVADMVRKMSPAQAVETLQFTNKAAAAPLAKAIQTALANVKSEELVFKSLEINEGTKLKRFRWGSHGHAKSYKKRWSHIKIVLTDEMGEMKKEKVETEKEVVKQETRAIEEKVDKKGKK